MTEKIKDILIIMKIGIVIYKVISIFFFLKYCYYY